MNKKEMFEKLTDTFSREICFYLAAGFTFKQIARILYEKGEICYWERDLLAKGVEKYDYETGLN